MEQITLDGDIIRTEDIPEPDRRRYKKPIEMYGPGPEGETCRTCSNRIEGYCGNKFVRKCPEWILSHSETTDIRLKWAACGKWKERANDAINEGRV